MPDYTTLSAVKSQLNIEASNTDDDTLIETFVTQASEMIDSVCNRRFIATPGTLKLDACPPHLYGNTLFFGDDVTSVLSISDANGEIDSANYWLKPNNTSPKWGAAFKSGYTPQYDSSAQQAITVVGSLGYAVSAPSDINLAATRLAAWMYQTRDNTGESVRFMDGTTIIPANAPPLVMTILQRGRYIKDELEF